VRLSPRPRPLAVDVPLHRRLVRVPEPCAVLGLREKRRVAGAQCFADFLGRNILQ
jgi:hypothetical protein